MALITTINSLGQQSTMTGKQFSPGRRIYLDKEGNAVEADNPSRLTLLCPAHGSIPMSEAIRLGLVQQVAIEAPEAQPVEVEVTVEAEVEKAEEEPETKAEPKSKDKAVKPKSNK